MASSKGNAPIKIDPAKVVSKKLYNATLAYVNRQRKARKKAPIKELPYGSDGADDCSLCRSLEDINQPFLLASSRWPETVPVRVTKRNGKFRIRLHTSTGKPVMLLPPKLVQEFIQKYDEALP